MRNLLNRPVEKKHWLIFGFLFLALWIPRIVLFSADAANVCDVATEASATHNHDSTTSTATILDSTTSTATILDPQMRLGHCGTLMAVMHSQLSLPQISIAEVIENSPPLLARMAGPSTSPIELHSRPSSTRKIYLDFDGYVFPSSSAWLDFWDVSPGEQLRGISFDNDYSTFSAAENAYILEIWKGVSEDFAPFDIDVTTVDPGVAGLSRSSSGDDYFGTTAVVSSDYTWSDYCNCGGVAYVGIVDRLTYSDAVLNPYTPSFNFVSHSAGQILSTSDAAGVISHETGHNVGLGHDGTNSVGYYSGHANGLWAPIMGTSPDAIRNAAHRESSANRRPR